AVCSKCCKRCEAVKWTCAARSAAHEPDPPLSALRRVGVREPPLLPGLRRAAAVRGAHGTPPRRARERAGGEDRRRLPEGGVDLRAHAPRDRAQLGSFATRARRRAELAWRARGRNACVP